MINLERLHRLDPLVFAVLHLHDVPDLHRSLELHDRDPDAVVVVRHAADRVDVRRGLLLHDLLRHFFHRPLLRLHGRLPLHFRRRFPLLRPGRHFLPFLGSGFLGCTFASFALGHRRRG